MSTLHRGWKVLEESSWLPGSFRERKEKACLKRLAAEKKKEADLEEEVMDWDDMELEAAADGRERKRDGDEEVQPRRKNNRHC